MEAMDWVHLLGGGTIGYLVGLVVGWKIATSVAADAQVADVMPAWWKRALEFAKGRKAAREIREDTNA